MKYEPNAWNNTKSLGDVYLDENGCVEFTTFGEGVKCRRVYPYRAHMVYNGWEWRQEGWDNCSGYYKPAYLARLIREGKAKWA